MSPSEHEPPEARGVSVAPQRVARLWGFVLGWGGAIIAGAVYLKVFRPERDSALLAALVGSEPFHVFAHIVLYGTLAAGSFALFGPARRASAVALVMAIAVVQECAQSALFGKTPWLPELFDLGVDAVTVLAVRALFARASPAATR